MRFAFPQSLVVRALCASVALAALALPAGALAATRPSQRPQPQPARPPVQALGTLTQLPGRAAAASSTAPAESVRRLRARARARRPRPVPRLATRVAISPDGKNVYVASSRSDAIAIFRRDARTGTLTQRAGAAGCIAARGAGGCASARALNGPNSVAVSADGRNVYATSLVSDAVAVFRRDRATGALTPGSRPRAAASPAERSPAAPPAARSTAPT